MPGQRKHTCRHTYVCTSIHTYIFSYSYIHTLWRCICIYARMYVYVPTVNHKMNIQKCKKIFPQECVIWVNVVWENMPKWQSLKEWQLHKRPKKYQEYVHTRTIHTYIIYEIIAHMRHNCEKIKISWHLFGKWRLGSKRRRGALPL